MREWDAAVLGEAGQRAAERWRRAGSSPSRVNAAIRAWAAAAGRQVAPTGRIPTALREAWLEAIGGVVADPRAERRNLGHTEAAQAYRLLHTGMAQAMSDGLIPANPRAIKGASQRDSRQRTERRVLTPDELRALADAMPERYRAAVVVAFLSGLDPDLPRQLACPRPRFRRSTQQAHELALRTVGSRYVEVESDVA